MVIFKVTTQLANAFPLSIFKIKEINIFTSSKRLLKIWQARNLSVDFVVAAFILMLSFWFVATELSYNRSKGYLQLTYQVYLEPAVSLACGKGFSVHTPPISLQEAYQSYYIKQSFKDSPLSDFLYLKRNTLNCSDLPNTVLNDNPPQKIWYYLISTIGVLWKIFGISWPVLDLFLAFLFALSSIAYYGIFRLGMGRTISLLLTLLLCGSALQLSFIPWFRDYAKAPFLLFIFLILGILVKYPLKTYQSLMFSILLGCLIGIGYGFRTDLLITMPAIICTVLFLTPLQSLQKIPLKIFQVSIIFTLFYVLAHPIFSANATTGSCSFGNPIMGLARPFDSSLKLKPSPLYEMGHQYNDLLAVSFISAHAYSFMQLDIDQTRHPSSFSFCSKGYNAAAASLFKHFALLIPADLLLKAYASMGQILNLGFVSWHETAKSHWQETMDLPFWQTLVFQPRDNFLTQLYKHSRIFFGLFDNTGMGLAFLSIFIIGIFHLRIAIFLLLGTVFFASYPALVFISRHFFHLEFISLWFLGFLIYQCCINFKKLKHPYLVLREIPKNKLYRSATLVGGFCCSSVLLYYIANTIQTKNIQKLIYDYQNADKLILTKQNVQLNNTEEFISFDNMPPLSNTEYARGKMLLLEFGGHACLKKDIHFSIEYHLHDNIPPYFNFTKKEVLTTDANGEKTLFYLPVYQHKFFHFQGIKLSAADKACLNKVYEVKGLENYPLWITVNLPSHYSELPFHRTFKEK